MNERETRKIDKFKYVDKRKYFIRSGKELKVLAQTGDELAQKELLRRQRKTKRKKT